MASSNSPIEETYEAPDGVFLSNNLQLTHINVIEETRGILAGHRCSSVELYPANSQRIYTM